MAAVSDTIPVTLEAAEKLPIFSGRSAYRSSSSSSWTRSISPSRSSWIVTTSAIDSRHGSSLLWCSYGPMKTTGRWSAGMCSRRFHRSARSAGRRSWSTSTRRLIAAVEPEPTKITAWRAGSPPTPSSTMRRASSRNRDVWSPVPDDSVWVFAYSGRTASRM